MKTSNDFLDEVKRFHGLKSDYQLARYLKITDSRVSFYRTGKSRFDEDTCILIAKCLNCDPGYVMACVSGERTKSEPARAEWARVARLLGGLAASVLLVVTLTAGMSQDAAALPHAEGGGVGAFSQASAPVCILCQMLLMLLQAFKLGRTAYMYLVSLCVGLLPEFSGATHGGYDDYARA